LKPYLSSSVRLPQRYRKKGLCISAEIETCRTGVPSNEQKR